MKYPLRRKLLKRINPSYESPFNIFPIATWTLAIGVVVTFIALLYINFLYQPYV
jgi:hypothetical protein